MSYRDGNAPFLREKTAEGRLFAFSCACWCPLWGFLALVDARDGPYPFAGVEKCAQRGSFVGASVHPQPCRILREVFERVGSRRVYFGSSVRWSVLWRAYGDLSLLCVGTLDPPVSRSISGNVTPGDTTLCLQIRNAPSIVPVGGRWTRNDSASTFRGTLRSRRTSSRP